MDHYTKYIKHKYNFSVKHYNKIINDTSHDSYSYYLELLSPFHIFPYIIDFTIDTIGVNIGYLHNILNYNNYSLYNNLDMYSKHTVDKINELHKLKSSFDKHFIIPKSIHTKELREYIKNNLNGECVTDEWISFYEILNYYEIGIKSDDTVNYFSIGDNVGYSIFATNHYVKERLNKKFSFVAQTIHHKISKKNIDKYLYKKYKSNYDYACDSTGNIMNINNLAYYRKVYYDKHFDIISATIETNNDLLLSTQKNPMEILYAQIILALSLCDKKTTMFFKLISIYDEHSKQLLYLLSTLFTKINICKPVSLKNTSNEIYCVCREFKYNKSDMDVFILNICGWYEKFTKNNMYIIKQDIVDSNFYNQVKNINQLLFNKVIITYNYYYFISINKINDSLLQKFKWYYGPYVTNIYNIPSLNVINKLVDHKYSTSINYKQNCVRVVNVPNNMFINDIFLYHLLGKKRIINYNHQNIDYNVSYNNIVSEKYNMFDVSCMNILNKLFNPYYEFSMAKCLVKIIFIIKLLTNTHIIDIHNFITEPIHNRYNKYINVITKMEQYFDMKINICYSNDIVHPIIYENNKSFVFICKKKLYETYDGISISNIYIDFLMSVIEKINNGVSIVLFMHSSDIIYDIVNLFSKYFTKTTISKFKYYINNMVYVAFIDKCNTPSLSDITIIKNILNKGNVDKLYGDAITNSFSYFVSKINKDYNNRMSILQSLALYKLDDFTELNKIMDIINVYKKQLYTNFMNKISKKN